MANSDICRAYLEIEETKSLIEIVLIWSLLPSTVRLWCHTGNFLFIPNKSKCPWKLWADFYCDFAVFGSLNEMIMIVKKQKLLYCNLDIFSVLNGIEIRVFGTIFCFISWQRFDCAYWENKVRVKTSTTLVKLSPGWNNSTRRLSTLK